MLGFWDLGILEGVENKLVPNHTEMISMGFGDLGILGFQKVSDRFQWLWQLRDSRSKF